ncbi:MAG: DUF58 domain-containing protein [Pseudomonadota bacterium]
MRLKGLWQIRFRIPITPMGACVLFFAWWLFRKYGNLQQDFVLYSGALVAMGLVALSVVFVLIVATLLWLNIRKSTQTEQLDLESNMRSATGFSFAQFARWPMIQIGLQWETPTNVTVFMEQTNDKFHEIVTPSQRGNFPVLRRCFFVSDIFGLARFAVYHQENHPVNIKPSKTPVSKHLLTHLARGDAFSHPAGPVEGELLDIRSYSHGDPMRRLLWKAFARTRQLLVRTPERAITPSPSTAAYFVAGDNDESTASAARFFVEEGLLGQNFKFCADGALQPTSNPREAIEQIIESVKYRNKGAIGLFDFLTRIGQRHRQNCFLFVPPTIGVWLPIVEKAAKQIPGAIVVMAVDGTFDTPPQIRIKKLLFANEPDAYLRQLPNTVNRLSTAGFQAKVIHRTRGVLISVAQLDAIAHS